MIYNTCTWYVIPLRDLTWNNLLDCACHTFSDFITLLLSEKWLIHTGQCLRRIAGDNVGLPLHRRRISGIKWLHPLKTSGNGSYFHFC